jgi:hypothetical protein
VRLTLDQQVKVRFLVGQSYLIYLTLQIKMTQAFKAIRLAARNSDGIITSRKVANKLKLPINQAAAITCNLANDGTLRRKRKIKGTGVRWFWEYQLRR